MLMNLPFYGGILLLIYPLMLVSLFLYRGPLRWEIASAGTLFVLFYSFYGYITRGRNAAETLVAGFRYLLPVMPLFLFAYIGWLDGLARRYRIQVQHVVLPVAAVLLVFAFGLSRAHAAYLQRQVDLREMLLRETPPDAVLLCNKDIAKLFQPVWGYRECVLITDSAGHYRPPELERYVGRPLYLAVLLRSERPSEQNDAAEAVRRVLAIPGVRAEHMTTSFPDLGFYRVQLPPNRRDVAGPLSRVAAWVVRYPVSHWGAEWGDAVLMFGLLRWAEASGQTAWVRYVQDWADHHRDAPITGSSGTWGPALYAADLYRATGQAHYQGRGRAVCEFIRQRAARSADGGLLHTDTLRSLFVDTLFFSAAGLARMSALEGRPEWLDEAVQQVRLHRCHLFDERVGLFNHARDVDTGVSSEGFWARGNGWAAATLVEVLEALPEGDPRREELVDLLRRLLAAVASRQNASGLWPTVLNRPESYLETSASALFLYAFERSLTHGWIGKEYEVVLQRGWAGLRTYRIEADGRVTGVSAGTGPGNAEHYQSIRVGTEPWGAGAVLLAGAAWAEARQRDG